MTHLAKLMTESSDFKREKEMMFYGVQTQVTQISTRAPSVSLHLHMTRLTKLIAESSDFNRGKKQWSMVFKHTSNPDSNQGTFFCWSFRKYKCMQQRPWQKP